MMRLLAIATLASIAVAPAARAVDPTIPSAQLDSARGAALFAEHCAMCHEHPSGNIPPVFVLNYKSPEQIVDALAKGPMRQQAAGLSAQDVRELAIHLAHRAPGASHDPDPEANRCAQPAGPISLGTSSWNGVGANPANTRYQNDPGFAVADVSRLAIQWTFAYPGGAAYGAPVIVGNRLFVTTATGRIVSLDAKTGCTHWSWQADAPIRAAVSVGFPPASGSNPAAYFGDEKGFVYAVDAESGRPLWKTKVDAHPLVRITGSPTLFGDTLYVPVSAMDEGAEWDRSHPCCTFRGSVVALDAATGRIRWKTYMVPRPAVPLGRGNEAGTPLFGPAGAAIWSAPTLDPRRHLVYVATGNAYNEVEEGDTNAVVALDMATGERRWAVQPLPKDDPYTICRHAKRTDCARPAPEYLEFGDSPVLRDLSNGRSVLVVGQKSGVVYALDPDQDGRELWQARIGEGGPLGGVMYGAAADRSAVYVSVADRDAKPPFSPGGLSALSLEDGRLLWHASAPSPTCAWGKDDCSAAQPAAVAAIPGVVFSGSLDGHIRGFSTADGRMVWDSDTARTFDAVNGVKATGGSVNGYSEVVANGILYVISGGSLLTHPGNVLIAFSVARK